MSERGGGLSPRVLAIVCLCLRWAAALDGRRVPGRLRDRLRELGQMLVGQQLAGWQASGSGPRLCDAAAQPLALGGTKTGTTADTCEVRGTQ